LTNTKFFNSDFKIAGSFWEARKFLKRIAEKFYFGKTLSPKFS
jgi:hypothetical protein